MSQPPRKNFCGSLEPTHRAYRCTSCQTIRMRDYRERKRSGVVVMGPSCALCGIAQRNRYGIKVYRYALLRNVRSRHTKTGWTNKSVASIPLCDRCLIEQGYAKPEFVRKAA